MEETLKIIAPFDLSKFVVLFVVHFGIGMTFVKILIQYFDIKDSDLYECLIQKLFQETRNCCPHCDISCSPDVTGSHLHERCVSKSAVNKKSF